LAKSNHKGKSAARLLGVQILFEMEINGKNTKTVVKRLTEDYLKEISQLNKNEISDKDYLIKILNGVSLNQNKIDNDIKENLNNWSLSRIDSVSRAILRSACFEIHECDDVPPRVIINEYVNISKSFFSEKEPNFINGILDTIAKIYRKDEI
jgi:transcription antitermination protein NusB